jgi:BirA family transcriptional regulator, biotin operon repressor / biotin---[acetyl-CoA-carboxylase] ligase
MLTSTISSRIANKDFIYIEDLDSTNLYCLRELERLCSGTVIVANTQSAGRGRHGRTWFSPPGMNLYASLVLKPPFIEDLFVLIPQLSSLSIFRALVDFGVADAWIKWPNDIYVEHRKIAGVLTETAPVGSNMEALIVGFGVNLNMDSDMLDFIDKPATSVYAETGTKIDGNLFLTSLFTYFGHFYDLAKSKGASPIYQSWKKASRLKNKTVTISNGSKEIVTGEVIDLEQDGRIVIRSRTGEVVRFIGGEVSLQAPII